jgi:hypothetical protein
LVKRRPLVLSASASSSPTLTPMVTLHTVQAMVMNSVQ